MSFTRRQILGGLAGLVVVGVGALMVSGAAGGVVAGGAVTGGAVTGVIVGVVTGVIGVVLTGAGLGPIFSINAVSEGVS